MKEKYFGQESFNRDQFIAGGVTLFLTGSAGFVGNTLVLIITHRILRYRKNLPNVFIVLLAWVDLLSFPLIYPQSLIKYFFGVYVGNYVACDYQATVITFLFTSSILLVVFMSIDRLLALYKPFCYGQYVSYDQNKIMLTAIGLGTAILTLALLPSFGVGRNVLHFPGTFCLFEWETKTLGGRALFYAFMSFLALTLLLIAFCNLTVVFLVWRMMRLKATPALATQGAEETGPASTDHVQPVQENKGSCVELQFAKLSCAVAVSFVGCWSPFLLRAVMLHAGYPLHKFADFTAVRLASLHTVMNPWIYPLIRRKYREGFWYLLRLAAHYVTCTLVAKPQTTLDEIVEAQSGASQVRELYQEERRRSSAQRLVNSN